MNKFDEMNKIRKWVFEALDANDVSYAFEKLKFEWNGRFIARAADATPSRMRLRFASKLWPLMTETEKEETAKHEACHIAAALVYKKNCKHGPLWKATMRAAGLTPTRCLKVDTTSIKVPNARSPYVVRCQCDAPWFVTVARARKISNGARYTCRRCYTALDSTTLKVRDAFQGKLKPSQMLNREFKTLDELFSF